MKMKYVAMAAAGVCLLAMSAGTVSVQAAGAAQATAPIVLAQADTKKETVTEKVKRKVKRAWRNMTGYKFDVACPILIPLSHKSCTQTGKNVEDARAKCQAANPLCSVVEIR